MPVATHGAAIMLAVAHERRQAPPYGLVDTDKTIHEDHFSLHVVKNPGGKCGHVGVDESFPSLETELDHLEV